MDNGHFMAEDTLDRRLDAFDRYVGHTLPHDAIRARWWHEIEVIVHAWAASKR